VFGLPHRALHRESSAQQGITSDSSDSRTSRIGSKTRRFDGKIDNSELALHEHSYKRLKAYEELAHNCYGRTVKGIDLDENDRKRGAFTYRITQANVDYIEKNCFVLARNSPLATELVTAQPGDEREVITKQRDRYLRVSEVRTLEGPISLRSPSQRPNFRSMAIRRIGVQRPIILQDLRSVAYRLPLQVEAPSLRVPIADETDPGDLPRFFGPLLT
jgi:hypothetical protein